MNTTKAVTEVIAETLRMKPEQISATATLPELGADSLDMTDVILELEEKLNVRIPDTLRVERMSITELAKFIDQA